MNALWLEIYGEPTRIICQDATALDGLVDARIARHALLDEVGDIVMSAGSDETPENASITIDMPNESGQASRLFAVPPFGAVAELKRYDGVETITIFAGVVQEIELAARARMTLET